MKNDLKQSIALDCTEEKMHSISFTIPEGRDAKLRLNERGFLNPFTYAMEIRCHNPRVTICADTTYHIIVTYIRVVPSTE
mmetsp:Transcript_18085/g.30871  ORF Transcript_18085/g.30871 Transcript_18085/m.30871 type:complete len:80 (-) Transcript_18085:679-918(-)